MKNLISIVIPAYNEEKHIKSCLDSILKQNTSRKFEVLVADNNSSDNTRQIAAQYRNKLNLRVITEKQKGRGSARHAGFQSAEGSIILSTDADATVPPDWLENFLALLEIDTRVVAITGPCIITDQSAWTNTLFNFSQPLAMKIYKLFFGHYWLSGFNFAIRQETYLKSGGFDPRLNVQEDIDLSFKVSKIGSIKFLPTLSVTVSGRRFENGLISGALPYLKTFISYYWFKRKNIRLNDPR